MEEEFPFLQNSQVGVRVKGAFPLLFENLFVFLFQK